MGFDWNAKVSSIIQGNQWQFPLGPPDLNSVWERINYLPNQNKEDVIVWEGHPTGKYSIASAWELLRPKNPTLITHRLTWHPGSIPRHSFILWLAIQGRLSTTDRLHMQNARSNTCSLCDEELESHSHLFFNCKYSSAIWLSIATKTNIVWPQLAWPMLASWTALEYNKRKNITHIIPKLILSATIYHLWYERNNRVFNACYKNHSALEEDIWQLLRMHLGSMKNKESFPQEVRRLWCI